MPIDVPDELVVAKLSIEAASIALKSLFEKMKVAPRSEKIIITAAVDEAMLRLKAAQTVLTELEAGLAGDSTT
jgi:hypothetical protein